jgi:decaprenyl-phosphate phosphoribosyltransferase
MNVVSTASPPARTARPSLRGHLRIARFDHWVKNVFVLPGIAIAWTVDPARFQALHWLDLVLGILAVGLVASGNYVINEVLDAPFDRLHPLKCHRPVAAGEVSVPWAWVEWMVLFAAGLGVSLIVSPRLAYTMVALWAMGCIYNVAPVRAKDVPFLDVLVEAVNNPLRFLAGWYMTGTAVIPIASVLVSYWMAGCYFMAIKRFAECRDLRTKDSRVAYRPCYRIYTEQNLLISILFYGSLAMLFFGAYMGRYRLEMALAFPFVATVMAVYFALAFKPDSAAQRPEGLLREPALMVSVVLCAMVLALLLWVDVPMLHHMFPPSDAAAAGR